MSEEAVIKRGVWFYDGLPPANKRVVFVTKHIYGDDGVELHIGYLSRNISTWGYNIGVEESCWIESVVNKAFDLTEVICWMIAPEVDSE